MQAQTFTEAANEYIGGFASNPNIRIKTNYGTFAGKVITDGNAIAKVRIIVSNENSQYDSIYAAEKEYVHGVGTIWTEYVFKGNPVSTRKFKRIEDATLYYNKCRLSDIKAYKNVSIYKYVKRDKYIVGYFGFLKEKYLIDHNSTLGSIKSFIKIK